ncbi:MAG: EfeM/EfeO family lipoprotein [Nocardioides sp.]
MGFAARGATARTVGVGALVAALGVGVLSAAAADEASGVAGSPVDVGQAACGNGWTGGSAGPLTFALSNSAALVQEVQIQDVASRRIFVDVEDLGVGAARSVTLALPAGTYRFLCMGGADGRAFAGPSWTLTGDYRGATTPGVLPASELDFIKPVDAYSAWTAGQLSRLRGDVSALTTALRRGHLLAARHAWMRAQRQYLLLGAAYDAFGDLGDAIDSPVTPGVAPLTDPHLTGLPKLEAVLWHAKPVPAGPRSRAAKRARARVTAYLRQSAVPVARRLLADVTKVAATFDNPVQPSNTDMGLRSHEILEDALRFELTGRDDAGAHLTLFDVAAMVDATREVIAPLRDLLAERDPDLAVTDAWLDRLARYVDTFHRAGTDTWTPYGRLSIAQQRRLESILSQTVEYLSEIAVVIDPVQAGPA